MDYKGYWESDGMKNLVAGSSENPEGFDVLAFLRELVPNQEDTEVLDFGCGAGRLCTLCHTDKYLGVDLNGAAIRTARERNPGRRFLEVDVGSTYPDSEMVMAYTVFLHMCDDTLDDVLGRLAATSAQYILVAEILGREWRRGGRLQYSTGTLTTTWLCFVSTASTYKEPRAGCTKDTPKKHRVRMSDCSAYCSKRYRRYDP